MVCMTQANVIVFLVSKIIFYSGDLLDTISVRHLYIKWKVWMVMVTY